MASQGALVAERRRGYDRRRLTLRSFIQGGFTPRRRTSRRHEESHAVLDWHEPHLLFLSIMILLLSVTDAFLTLTLLMHGAEEANPILAFVLEEMPEFFAVIKMLFTGIGVLVLVAMARATVFRIIRVSMVMHWCFAAYLLLIAYEWWLLQQAL